MCRLVLICIVLAAAIGGEGCKFDPQPADVPTTPDAPNGPGATLPDAAVTTTPDAIAAGGCPVAYSAGFGTHKYRLTDRDYTWAAARDQCQTDGGHLVKLETSQEDDFITGAIDGGDHPFVWIGLADPTSTDHYVWTDSSALGTFDHFTFGIEPSSSDDCIDKSTVDIDGRWFAFDCTRQQRGVCECDG